MTIACNALEWEDQAEALVNRVCWARRHPGVVASQGVSLDKAVQCAGISYPPFLAIPCQP